MSGVHASRTLERRVRRAHRAAPARRRGDRRFRRRVVRHRPLLRVPPAQRVRPRRRQGRDRRGALPDRCSQRTDHGPNEGASRLERWTIDPAEGKVLEETLDDRPQEFPRLDEALPGPAQPLRLRRDVRQPRRRSRQVPAIKHDLVAGTTVEHDYGRGRESRTSRCSCRGGRDRRGRRLGDVVRPRRDDGQRRRRDPRRAGLHRRPRRHHPPAGSASRSASTATGSPPP